MNALQLPIIIDKVFEFLGLLDIEQCQYVCRAWRESALRRLNKCPAIDRCQVILEKEYWRSASNTNRMGKKAKQQKRLLVIENRKMNGVEFEDFTDLVDDFVYYWYYLRKQDLYQLLKFQIDDAVRKFLTTSVRCLPGFSLILYRKDFAHSLERMTFSHPTLLIKNPHVYDSSRGLRVSKKEIEKFSSSTSKKKIFWKLSRSNSFTFSMLEGLHISRSIPGLKIIITDWSDPQSPRPNVNDSEFSVKFVLYLATKNNYSRLVDRLKEIKLLLGESNAVTSAGAYMGSYSSIFSNNDIFLANSCKDKPRPVEEISIAFAGNEVKSATLMVKPRIDPRQSLEDFKLSLEFPIDDGRIIGFFLIDGWSSICLRFIREVFPGLKLLMFYALEDYNYLIIVRVSISSGFDAQMNILLFMSILDSQLFYFEIGLKKVLMGYLLHKVAHC